MDQPIQEEGLHIAESRGGEQTVWIFNGETSHFPSAVFLSFTRALNWIELYALTGTLTRYPLDKSVFDWAVENDFYQPNSTRVKFGSKTVANFSSAHLEHYHFKDGTFPTRTIGGEHPLLDTSEEVNSDYFTSEQL